MTVSLAAAQGERHTCPALEQVVSCFAHMVCGPLGTGHDLKRSRSRNRRYRDRDRDKESQQKQTGPSTAAPSEASDAGRPWKRRKRLEEDVAEVRESLAWSTDHSCKRSRSRSSNRDCDRVKESQQEQTQSSTAAPSKATDAGPPLKRRKRPPMPAWSGCSCTCAFPEDRIVLVDDWEGERHMQCVCPRCGPGGTTCTVEVHFGAWLLRGGLCEECAEG